MHQQFNIQQLYALPTLYLCVLYLSENKQRWLHCSIVTPVFRSPTPVSLLAYTFLSLRGFSYFGLQMSPPFIWNTALTMQYAAWCRESGSVLFTVVAAFACISYNPSVIVFYFLLKLWQISLTFLISNFRRVLYVVCFLLGNSPASEFCMPTFRNTLSFPSSQARRLIMTKFENGWGIRMRESLALK
jgi:hypothetical protein